jgi:hypothetical protein
MKIDELILESKTLKARISHPEDMIFDDGSVGAINALSSLLDSASSSKNISVKWDGSPSLIAGIVNEKFVLTDKVGLGKQRYAHTPKEMYSMIFDRKPDQIGRDVYSSNLAKLFGYVQKMMPRTFRGLVQFDVMWFNTPEVNSETNSVEFQPNKVLYSIPIDSDLGKEISMSQCGIVIHSYFENPTDYEPRGIQDFEALGLRPVNGLVVLNPKATFEMTLDPKMIQVISAISKYTKSIAKKIDSFFDESKLIEANAKDVPKLMKMFLAARARVGTGSVASLQNNFIKWLKSTSAISEKKRPFALNYIKENMNAYREIWAIVSQIVAVKEKLLKKLDNINNSIKAGINGVSSHEGYVVDAPTGKIKIVNRPLFMNDKTVGKFSPKSSSSVPI